MELNGFWSSVSNFYIQNSTFTFKKQINSTSDAKKKKKKKGNTYSKHLTTGKLSHKGQQDSFIIWHVLAERATNKSRYNTSSNQTNGRHIHHIKDSYKFLC